ncbi:MAG: DUF1780 domain-containing protein [Planctomycetes bacterium]|nr:DUF1780 domain-containing protein [Planctomycetota bacterium]
MNKKNERTSDEIDIRDCIKSKKDDIRFFSNVGRDERERDIVKMFLSLLDVNFIEKDVRVAKKEEEPVDVFYGEARFQNKEILDERRQRHKEYKDELQELVETQESPALEPWFPVKFSIEDAVNLAIQKAKEYGEKYPTEMKKLDLLLYFNHRDKYIKDDCLPDQDEIVREIGWRSISVIGDCCAFVLYADQNAPDFLKSNKRKIFR